MEGNNSLQNLCPHCKTKHREKTELKSLVNRLKRIEGQVRGIIGMLESDAYCADILVQTAAIGSAISSFNKELLTSHIKSCVCEDLKNGNTETADELAELIKKLMK